MWVSPFSSFGSNLPHWQAKESSASFCFVLHIRVFDNEWLEGQKDQVEIVQSQAPYSEPDIICEAC